MRAMSLEAVAEMPGTPMLAQLSKLMRFWDSKRIWSCHLCDRLRKVRTGDFKVSAVGPV